MARQFGGLFGAIQGFRQNKLDVAKRLLIEKALEDSSVDIGTLSVDEQLKVTNLQKNRLDIQKALMEQAQRKAEIERERRFFRQRQQGVSPTGIDATNRPAPRVPRLAGTAQQSFDNFRDQRGAVIPRVAVSPDAPLSLQRKAATADIGIQKSISEKIAKDQLTTAQDLINVDLKIDNSFDTFLDVVERTRELTGAGPGIIGGTFSKILGGVKANEFVEGFEGSLIEVAAAVGRIAIPGARATRLVNLFKKTGISINDTIESAVSTSADSFRNAIATDMSRNPREYLTREQARLPKQQRNNFLKESLREFERTYRNTLLRKSYQRNPNLLSTSSRSKVESLLQGEETLRGMGLDVNEYEIIGVE